jgi:hypothetical protein
VHGLSKTALSQKRKIIKIIVLLKNSAMHLRSMKIHLAKIWAKAII